MRIVFLISLFFLSCGRLEESPYLIDIKEKKYNDYFMSKLSNKKINKIIIVSDIHNSYEELDKIVDKINKVDLLLITGDISNLGLNREYENLDKILSKIKIPFLTTAGNHDLLNQGEGIFFKLFGSFNFYVDILDLRIVMYNNNNWESSRKNYYSKTWLEEVLSTSLNNIVLTHVPFNDKDRFNEEEILELKRIYNENNVFFSFNGHNHNYGKKEYENFTSYTVGSIDKKSYLVLTLDELEGYKVEKVNF